jgi:hypothetical protein
MRLHYTAAVLVGVLVGAACVDTVDVCDPMYYPGGTSDPSYIDHCISVDDSGCCPPGFATLDPSDPTTHCVLFDAGLVGVDGVCAGDAGNAPDAGDAGDTSDASADGPIGSCVGQCLPFPPNGWDYPSLVWIGPEGQALPCPAGAPTDAYDGHADLSASDLCGECQCGPPAGSCGLPATLTAHAATCAATGPFTPSTPFDSPGGWDGGCTTDEAIAGGLSCDGGPCVQSVTIAPLTVNDVGCTPSHLPVTNEPPSWGMLARSCRGGALGQCANDGFCLSPAPPGFHVCIWHEGAADCSGPDFAVYSEPHVVYAGYEDTRGCSPCACGPPAGSTCASTISIYTDGACSAPLVSSMVTSSGPGCHDGFQLGAALGSKSASPPIYTPGTCQPSGGPTGSVTPIGPSTLCCIPSP